MPQCYRAQIILLPRCHLINDLCLDCWCKNRLHFDKIVKFYLFHASRHLTLLASIRLYIPRSWKLHSYLDLELRCIIGGMAKTLVSTGFPFTTLPADYVRPAAQRPRLAHVVKAPVPIIDLRCPTRAEVIRRVGQACLDYGCFQVCFLAGFYSVCYKKKIYGTVHKYVENNGCHFFLQ